MRSLRALLAATAALLALPAGASAVGPPYTIAAPAPGTLQATPGIGSSTLALQVKRTAAGVEFSPAASSAPAGCTSTLDKTTCADATIATELALQGAQLEVDVELRDVSTGTLRLTGGADADTMTVAGPVFPDTNSIGQVVLDPGAGNDAIAIGGLVGAITMAAADPGGDDRYVVTSTNATIGGTLDLGSGNDVAISSAPNLALDGGSGADALSGSGPLAGGAGNDVLRPAVLGKAAAGGDDVDRLSYDLLATPLEIGKSGTDVAVSGDAVVKSGIEQVEGSRGADTFVGTPAQDVFVGGDGDDVFDGRGGGDVIDGGAGLNTVTYALAASAVTVDLNAGTGGTAPLDALARIRGVVTGPAADTVVGTSADELFVLGDGNDVLNAGAGNDAVDAGTGDDVLLGGPGSDVLDGGPGADTASYNDRGASQPLSVTLATLGGDGEAGENDALPNIENVIGGASNDTIVGDAAANVIDGGPGLNTLDGGAGDDRVSGGNDRDVITGGPGNDALFGYGDDDSINAFDASTPDADVVACGDSADDDAQVDASDSVSGCEYSRRADVPIPVDADGDGFVGGFDCDDANPARNQGARDIPGDGIDQDCDGFDTPVPFVDYGLSAKTLKPSRRQRGSGFRRLVVTRLAADRRVVVTCKSARARVGRCPFRSATRRPRSGQVSLTALFKNRRLAPGARVEFRVTAPGHNGRVRRFTVRGASLRSQELCLVAPSTRPRRCPPGEDL